MCFEIKKNKSTQNIFPAIQWSTTKRTSTIEAYESLIYFKEQLVEKLITEKRNRRTEFCDTCGKKTVIN